MRLDRSGAEEPEPAGVIEDSKDEGGFVGSDG